MRYVALFAVIFCVTSCIGTKRYARFVNEGYKKPSQVLQSVSPAIVINQNSSIVDTLAIAVNRKSQFVPAIIFWQWEKSISATLAEKHQANKIQSYMAGYLDSLQVAKQLGENKKLIISIDRAPATFTYTLKGFFVYLVVAYVNGSEESIKPEFSDLKLSYTVVDSANSVLKKGDLTVLDRNVPSKNTWKSTKKFTWKYLEEYDANVKLMSREAVNKLSKEL